MQNDSKSFSYAQKWCVGVDYNFIIVLPKEKYYLLLTFYSQDTVFSIFWKILICNSCNRGVTFTIKSNISYIFCNKSFKAFLEGQMSIKINQLLCLQSKTYTLDVAACHFCTHSHLFRYSIYSLTSVATSQKFKSS